MLFFADSCRKFQTCSPLCQPLRPGARVQGELSDNDKVTMHDDDAVLIIMLVMLEVMIMMRTIKLVIHR